MAFNKRAFTLSLIGVVSFLTIVGSTAGTLSWYAYSTSTLLSYTGTSVQKSGVLGIGIVDPYNAISSSTINRYDLEKEGSVVWTKSSNGLDAQVIKEYLLNSGHAYNKLPPVTSHSRANYDSRDFHLYKAPEFGKTYNETLVSTGDYVELPFVFRILDEHDNPKPNIDIWLTDAVVEASAGQHIREALRVHVDNGTSKFLMRPADDTTDISDGKNYTKVGGVLDLDGDGTYDFSSSYSTEYYYGEYKSGESIAYAENAYGIDFDHAELDNVNGSPYEVASTFVAKHNENAKVASFNDAYVGRAYYYPFGYVNPEVISGLYTAGVTGIPISRTDAVTGLGYATLTIYLEGWDFSVVDDEIDHSFNLGLTFEVNR